MSKSGSLHFVREDGNMVLVHFINIYPRARHREQRKRRGAQRQSGYVRFLHSPWFRLRERERGDPASSPFFIVSVSMIFWIASRCSQRREPSYRVLFALFAVKLFLSVISSHVSGAAIQGVSSSRLREPPKAAWRSRVPSPSFFAYFAVNNRPPRLREPREWRGDPGCLTLLL